MSDELSIRPGGFKVGGAIKIGDSTQKLTGLAARKAAALAQAGIQEVAAPKTAAQMEHRIGIIFDDSGSMQHAQREDAKAGCEEFLRSCEKDNTAVAVYPLASEPIQLCSNLPAVAIMIRGISEAGRTPIVSKTKKMLLKNNLTRAIIFSDGAPDNSNYSELLAFKVPIDTVYIPNSYISEDAVKFMKSLAQETGGIYLQFERGKSNFRTAFKYLSPGLRHMLADKSFVDKLEGR